MHELSLSEMEEPIPIWLTATTVLSMQLWGAQRRVPRCSSLSWRGLGVRGTRTHKETWTPWGLCWPGHRTPQLCPPWEQCWQPLCTQPPPSTAIIDSWNGPQNVHLSQLLNCGNRNSKFISKLCLFSSEISFSTPATRKAKTQYIH